MATVSPGHQEGLTLRPHAESSMHPSSWNE